MARATCIYVACDDLRTPLATFTVKHECKTWIRNNPSIKVRWVAVYPDGRYMPTIPVYTVVEFLESKR